MEVIIMPTAEKAVKPPLLVPVLRDRLLGELCDGQPIGFVDLPDATDAVWKLLITRIYIPPFFLLSFPLL